MIGVDILGRSLSGYRSKPSISVTALSRAHSEFGRPPLGE